MNIYVDENIPFMTVQALRKMGHTVFDNRGTPKEGISDDKLWKIVQRQKCLLATTDKGFTNCRNEQHYGILIVRLRQPNRRKIHDRVMQAINQFAVDEWPGLLVIMRDNVKSVWSGRSRGKNGR
jgi:predicted nuclease of predicted toxin-antitoxin system